MAGRLLSFALLLPDPPREGTAVPAGHLVGREESPPGQTRRCFCGIASLTCPVVSADNIVYGVDNR